MATDHAPAANEPDDVEAFVNGSSTRFWHDRNPVFGAPGDGQGVQLARAYIEANRPSRATSLPAPPSSADVDEALAWFRANNAVDRLGFTPLGPEDDAVRFRHAATLVRAALAADEEPPDLCHCGRPEFLSDDPVFAQFMGTKMCAHCIDNRCDAYPGSCDAPLSSPPAGDTTIETVRERRVAGIHPDGNPRFHDDDLIRRFGLDVFLAHLSADGYTDLRVESRTVSTTRTESPWEEEQ